MDSSKSSPPRPKEADVDRLIAEFGRPLPERTRQRIESDLAWQKEKFLALERIRHRAQQRRGRER